MLNFVKSACTVIRCTVYTTLFERSRPILEFYVIEMFDYLSHLLSLKVEIEIKTDCTKVCKGTV